MKADDLFGVIGKEFDFADAEVVEHLCSHSVVAKISGVAEFFVGFDGVEPLFLEFVGVYFGSQPDASPFLTEVEENAAFFGDLGESGVELSAAVAASRSEDVTGEAFRVDADGDWLVGVDVASDEGEVFGVVCGDVVEVALEVAVVGWEGDGLLEVDESFGVSSVFDDLGDGAGFELVFFLIVAEVSDASHGAIFVHDFADDGGGWEFGKLGEVEGGLGVPGTAEGAAWSCFERKDVSWLDEVLSGFGGVGDEVDGVCSVVGGDSGGNAGGGVDGDGEGCLV